MIEIKEGLLWVKTTLKESFQEAIKKILVHAIGALIVIGAIAVIALLIWFVEVIKMYEVAILCYLSLLYFHWLP
mgnify:CR=1 FL=1